MCHSISEILSEIIIMIINTNNTSIKYIKYLNKQLNQLASTMQRTLTLFFVIHTIMAIIIIISNNNIRKVFLVKYNINNTKHFEILNKILEESVQAESPLINKELVKI